jgi:FKBP-type peptidyl-prolyl cis-trans isomerase SlyD
MTIRDGHVVNLAYTLKNSGGEVLDRATNDDPFTYLHGSQMIVPGLENALTGLALGAKKSVQVAPSEGYGEVDPSLRLTVTRAQFPAGMDIKPGMQFETQTPEGHSILFTVEGAEGDKISINGNHPLAGQTLHFEVEVLSVREATAEEKAHGHAHGPDGHHAH